MDFFGSFYFVIVFIKYINVGVRVGFCGKKNEFYFEYIEFEVIVGILGIYVLKVVLYINLVVLDKS